MSKRGNDFAFLIGITMDAFGRLQELFGQLTKNQQSELIKPHLKNLLVHPLEKDWNVSADLILEAISRSQDITKRGVRGIIAELCFLNHVIAPLETKGWKSIVLHEDLPYDALLENDKKQVRIQVKNQRLKKGTPLTAADVSTKKFNQTPNWWIAECQKTRTGISADGKGTRAYRFGQFDVLAVCLQPSTNDWSKFMFAPSSRLHPRADASLIEIMQPVAPTKQGIWTDSLEECIALL